MNSDEEFFTTESFFTTECTEGTEKNLGVLGNLRGKLNVFIHHRVHRGHGEKSRCSR